MRKPTKTTVFVYIVLAVLLFVFNTILDIRKADYTNILFIVLDAARADHFSCYGYERITTPNIDTISREGAIFLNNFTQETRTHVSLPQIFSSRYYSLPIYRQAEFGFLAIDAVDSQIEDPSTIFRRFDAGQILLPEVLSLSGYKTVLFSENSFIASDASYVAQKFDEFYNCYFAFLSNSEEEIVPKVISWLEQNKKNKFFVYCHILCPHIPYRAKKERAEFFSGESISPLKPFRIRFGRKQYGSTADWSPEDIRILKGFYDSNLEYADNLVGMLYNKLKELGLQNDTLIVITSDHGEDLGDHNYITHGCPAWDSLIRVPLIMVHPRKITPGVKIKGMSESVDIMPTILDLCNIRIPKNKSMDGRSLAGFIKHPDRGKPYIFSQNAVRSEAYKYILDIDALYDLKKDPEEKMNISDKNYELKEKLKQIYRQNMNPYLQRYEKSRKTKNIDYPFYYLLNSFKITSADHIETYEEADLDDIMRSGRHLKKPYAFNAYPFNCFLAYFPKEAPALHLTLSTSVPNGSYQMSILLKTLEPISYPPGQFGFQFRFDPNKPFLLPCQLKNFFISEGCNYYYIELGEAKIEKEGFSLEIKFTPPDEKIYILQHVKFVPRESRREKSLLRYDEDDMRRKLESLKSLGYVQ